MNQKNENGWQNLITLCTQIESPVLFEEFLKLFLTFEERETLGSRFLILKALMEGQLTQREIAEKYKVSISQITRGSNALKIANTDVKKLLL